MIKEREEKLGQIEFVCLEQLVPESHLLRKIEKTIDLSFIYEKVEGLYCLDNGRPALDPVVFFKILLIGYLFGIRSERRLMKEIEVNLAYRWFLGYGLSDKIPDHSTLSQNRRRRFAESNVYQEIFDEIVLFGVKKNMITGKTLYTDSTHLKANANKRKYELKEVQVSTKSYLDELEADINKDRKKQGKKPLKKKDADRKDDEQGGDSASLETREIKQSTTDAESGYMYREGKPEGFFYLDHRTVDSRYALITDVHVTAGNVHDSQPYLERLDRQRTRFGFEIKNVGVDSGYFTPAICKGLFDREIYGSMPYKRPGGKKGMLRKTAFYYDAHYDCYLCPKDQVLSYSTTSRDGYRQYKSNPEHCQNCPLLSQCTQSRNQTKIIARHLWEGYKEQVVEHRYEEKGKALYKRRKETVERSFADAKELHGHRYARFRGKAKVQAQCLLAATAQNMKKIATLLCKEALLLQKSLSRSKNTLNQTLLALRRSFETLISLIPKTSQHLSVTLYKAIKPT